MGPRESARLCLRMGTLSLLGMFSLFGRGGCGGLGLGSEREARSTGSVSWSALWEISPPLLSQSWLSELYDIS